jgi:hypothetical protein
VHMRRSDFTASLTKYWGGGAKFSTICQRGFGVPLIKALSYANLSEHGSLDGMNKESRVVPFD